MRDKTKRRQKLGGLICGQVLAVAIMKAQPFKKIASISLAVMFFLTLFMGVYANRADAATVVKVPSVTNSPATSITSSSATLNGNISSNGLANITSYGFWWGTSAYNTPNKLEVGTSNFIGSYSANLPGLSKGTAYYYCTYADNSWGESEASPLSFTTLTVKAPSVTTSAATSIATSAATLNGNISNNGGGSITSYGFVWGSSPSTLNYGLVVGTSNFTGSYSANLPGLSKGTAYYFEAYATNSAGTSYGVTESFT